MLVFLLATLLDCGFKVFHLARRWVSGKHPAIIISVVVVLNLLLSFLFQWYILIAIGPGLATDGLVIAMMVPQFVLSVITGPLLNVVVPIITPKPSEQASTDIWTLLHILGALALIGAAALAGSASLWVPAIIPEFSNSAASFTVVLTRILSTTLVSNILTMVAWCAYRAQGRFLQLESRTLVGNVLGLLALIIVLPRGGIVGAAWIMAARSLIQFVLLMPGLGAYALPKPHSPSVHLAWKRSLPMLGGAAFYKVTYLTDRAFAAMAPASSLSLFNLGQLFYSSVEQVVNKSLVAPLVPGLSRLVASKEWETFRRTCWRSFFVITGLMSLAFGGVVVVGEPLLYLLVGHGNVSRENVHVLWLILVALGGQLIISPASSMLNAVFYTSGQTVTPTIIGAIATVMGIGFRYFGLQSFGIVGLAIGASAQYVLALILLIPAVVRYNPGGRPDTVGTPPFNNRSP